MSENPNGAQETCGVEAIRIRIQDLVVRYRQKIVLDIPKLDFATGVTALTGANGAGKTTLLKVLAALLPPAAGKVGLGDEWFDPRRLVAERYRQAIGYLPQDAEFPGNFTVREAVTYSAWLREVPGSRRVSAVQQVLEELRLCDVATTQLKNLSGGNRQRTHVAQAIVHKPSALLLDEPTTGIDVEHRVELRAVLDEISHDCCVVMSTHHTEDVELLADRVVSLRGGRVVFRGTPQELMERAEADSVDVPHPAHEARTIERALRDLGGDAR